MAAHVMMLLAEYPRLQVIARELLDTKDSQEASAIERKEAELALKELRLLAESACAMRKAS